MPPMPLMPIPPVSSCMGYHRQHQLVVSVCFNCLFRDMKIFNRLALPLFVLFVLMSVALISYPHRGGE